MTVTIQQTLEHLRAQERRRSAAANQRAARQRALLPDAAALLKERYGARRVQVFGSLATNAVTPSSDVDLAVEGLPSPAYFDALADLIELFGGAVDLVRVEDAPPSLRQAIAEDGEAL